MPLSRKQIAAIVGAEDAAITILEGAVRSGKTFAVCLRFYAMVADAPRSGLILITGRTLQTIERNIIEPMQDPELFGELALTVQHTRGSSTATIMGREVHLIGAADARAENKLRGLTACLAMADEATLMPEEFWTQLLARLSVNGAKLLATTNPGSPRHWLKTKFLDRASEPDLRLARFHFTLEDNPSLSDEYKRGLRASNTGLFYRRNVLGEWVAAEGSIYDMFDPDLHVIPHASLPPMERVLAAGIDYGDTHPTRGVLLGLGRTRAGVATLYVIDEWVPGAMVMADRSLSFRTWLANQPEQAWRFPSWIVVDSAAAAFKMQLFYDGLRNVMNSDKASVVDGIRTVASLLTTGRLLISDRCKHLIDELPSYAWDPKATERGEDAPLKTEDDSADALRYAIHTTRNLWRPMVPVQAAADTAPGADRAA
nr:PBSX family phage terminase large subunit [Enterococcus hirae]